MAAVTLILVHIPAQAQLPDPGFVIEPERTALVITDPQNDFLSPDGVTWGVVGKNVTENRTVENIEALFKAAQQNGIQVFVSPHYYYKHDHRWKFEGALETLMHKIGMFDRPNALNLKGFDGSGADWLERYKPYIEDGETVVVSPHKVYGPETNDLVLQLRKRGIDKVILGGMSANLCTESHMRELVEQGFEVAVVSDATAAAVLPEFDGYKAAMTNFRMIASHVWKTGEAVQAMQAASHDQVAAGTRDSRPTLFKTVKIDGLDVFYREAGREDAPTILLLHGFPTSSHMFRNLIPALSDRFHLIAPDYPGYGNSSIPTVDEFEYSFDRFADIIEKLTVRLGLKRYSLYVMDYGAPVGFRLAAKHPERVEALIVQNGNAYVEGIDNNFWEPIKAYWKDRRALDQGLDNPWWKNVKAAYKKSAMSNEEALRFLLTMGATKWQYTNGARNPEAISPDTWTVDQQLLDRPGNQEIQLQMFFDYGSNPPLYPKWQAYFRKHQPPTLIVWGENDEIFPATGAYPYKRDLKNVEFHLFDTGHFALEEDGRAIAHLIRNFLGRNLSGERVARGSD
ncbi:MAG: hypothetical protein DHS20C16_23360 [Phycisphaerae bacterium]|nr:MAG: hypothetical protein DHS20C16_23360 [Phycisphaerae bacterium]